MVGITRSHITAFPGIPFGATSNPALDAISSNRDLESVPRTKTKAVLLDQPESLTRSDL